MLVTVKSRVGQKSGCEMFLADAVEVRDGRVVLSSGAGHSLASIAIGSVQNAKWIDEENLEIVLKSA